MQPDVMAILASSYVASVWPMEYTIPREMISGIAAVMVATSGAAVIILMRGGSVELPLGDNDGLMFEDPYISSRSSKPFIAGRRRETLWIPFLVGLRKGPSQWAPRDSAPSDAIRLFPEGPRNGKAYSNSAKEAWAVCVQLLT